MVSLIAQLLGGFLGGSVFGKIVHVADVGVFWNAVMGTLGGVAGGQLIGFILGKTDRRHDLRFLRMPRGNGDRQSSRSNVGLGKSRH